MTIDRTPRIFRGRPPTIDVTGTVTQPSSGSIVATEYGDEMVRHTRLTLTNVVISVADAAGAFGSQKVYDFPPGMLDITGAICNLTATVTAGITTAIKYAVGTVAEATNDTLAGTDANFIPSTGLTITAGTGSATSVTAARVGFLDGRSTAVDAILNIGVVDANINANATVTVSGTIDIMWQNLGTLNVTS